MSDHILNLLKKRRLTALKRSQSMSEAREQHVADKANSVRLILGGESVDSPLSIGAFRLKALYYDMISAYTGKDAPFAKAMTPKTIALWERVEAARQEAGCDPDKFMKAQFVWFDKNFGTSPKKYQLATEAAVERAQEYSGSTEGKVLGNIRKAPITKADVFRESEKTLQKMMAAQECTREEFYRKFVLTGLYSFDKEFLKADPTYQRVIKE